MSIDFRNIDISMVLRITAIFVMGALLIGCVEGPRGATGPAGPPGQGIRPNDIPGIVSTINCDGQIVNAGILDGLFVNYSAHLTASGDVYVTANIHDSNFQVSGTRFYASGQSGANSAAINIIYDVVGFDNGGYFRISLNRNTLITTVTYYDDDPYSGPNTASFTADACLIQNW